MKTECVFSHQC